MVRVGGLSDLATLKRQPVDNKSNLTPAEQIARISSTLPPLLQRAGTAFNDTRGPAVRTRRHPA